MAIHTCTLFFTHGEKRISLRELNGYDELIVDDEGSAGILQLLKRLIVDETGDHYSLKVEKISLADRDMLLSRIFQYTYGPRIESSVKCRNCLMFFDLNFSLDDLLSHTRNGFLEMEKDGEGYYHSGENISFRLPDGEDELAVRGMPAEEAVTVMVNRCIPRAGQEENTLQIQDLMEKVAPMMLSDMPVVCPECSEQQLVHFDMQNFLQARMKNERKRVAAEVHCLASAYHWSHREILELPRSLRKTYAGFTGLE